MAEYSKFDNEGKKITYRCEIPSPQYLSGDVAISDPLNYRQVNENFHTLEGMTLSGMKYDDGILWVKRADGKTASADIVGYSSGAQIVIDDVVCTLKDIMAAGESVGQVVAPRSQEYGFNFIPSGSVSVLKGNDGEVVIYVPTGKITLEDGTEVSVNSADVYMNDFKVGTVLSPNGTDIGMNFSGDNGIDVSQTGNTIVVSAKEGTIPGLPIGDDETITIMPFIVSGDNGNVGATAGRFVVASGLNMDHAGFKMTGSGGIETITSGNTVIVNGPFGDALSGELNERIIRITDLDSEVKDVTTFLTNDGNGLHFDRTSSVLPELADNGAVKYHSIRFHSLISSLKDGHGDGISIQDGDKGKSVIIRGDGNGIDVMHENTAGNEVFTISSKNSGQLPGNYKSENLMISGNAGNPVSVGKIVYDTEGGGTVSGFTISGTNGISVSCTGNTIQVSGKINPQEDYSEVGMQIGQASPSSAVSEVCKFLATSGVGNSFIFRSTPSVFIEPETGQSTHKYTDVKYHALITSIGPEKDDDSGHTIEFKDYDQNTGFPSSGSYDRHLKVIGREGIYVGIDPSASTITLSGSGKSLYLLGKEGSPESGFSGSSYYIQPENGITARVESSGSDRTILHIGSDETPAPTEQRKFYYDDTDRQKKEIPGDIHFSAGAGMSIVGSSESSSSATILTFNANGREIYDSKSIQIQGSDLKPIKIVGANNANIAFATGETANVITVSFANPVVEKEEEGSSSGEITLSENTVPTISLNASSSEGKETLENVALSIPSSSETYSIVVNVDKSMSGRNLNELITASGYAIDTWIDESGSERENITIPSSFERLTYFVTITNGMAIITRSVTSTTARKTV